jgi:hypothetical protein
MSGIIASNGYIGISYIDYGIDDYVVLSNGKKCLIEYDNTGLAYFIYNRIRYDLGEFIRTDI